MNVFCGKLKFKVWNVWVWLVGVASGSGWNLWVWLAGGGCGWNLWVWLVGVVVRRDIDFLILLISTPLVAVLFCSSIPTFCSFFCFSFLFQYFFVIKFYVLKTFFSQYKHTYGRPTAAIYEGCTYKKKHTQTNASYPAMDISCVPSSGWV